MLKTFLIAFAIFVICILFIRRYMENRLMNLQIDDELAETFNEYYEKKKGLQKNSQNLIDLDDDDSGCSANDHNINDKKTSNTSSSNNIDLDFVVERQAELLAEAQKSMQACVVVMQKNTRTYINTVLERVSRGQDELQKLMYDVLDAVSHSKINKNMVSCGSQTDPVVNPDVHTQSQEFNNIFSFAKNSESNVNNDIPKTLANSIADNNNNNNNVLVKQKNNEIRQNRNNFTEHSGGIVFCPERLFSGNGAGEGKNLFPQNGGPLPFLGNNPKSPLKAKIPQQPNKSCRFGTRNPSVSPQSPQCDNSAPPSSNYYNNNNSNNCSSKNSAHDERHVTYGQHQPQENYRQSRPLRPYHRQYGTGGNAVEIADSARTIFPSSRRASAHVFAPLNNAQHLAPSPFSYSQSTERSENYNESTIKKTAFHSRFHDRYVRANRHRLNEDSQFQNSEVSIQEDTTRKMKTGYTTRASNGVYTTSSDSSSSEFSIDE